MLNYFSRLRNTFILSAIVFGIGLIIGVMIIFSTSPQMEEAAELQRTYKAGWYSVYSIFLNNILVCLVLMLGLFTFGIPTFIYLLINGISIGAGLTHLILSDQPLLNIFLKVIPHGIFEIPFFLLAGAIGFLGFTFYFNRKYGLKFLLKHVVMVIIGILLASIVEGLITLNL
ncbi:stage II sporulation protein M [Aeribacillus composti]|jgi:stage II sporulation protein M|uniref:Stage II sporulation protein M n=1 Tax=Aeribacillus composti TaxID=1868734 RepID=A0ABY9WAB1_9BACI|nr:stage II sporulation protein M [Aeribacillus composti]WNF32648.1 stage II sporulation protein M [Aeribacillus composti]